MVATLTQSRKRGWLVLALLVATLAVGALALPALGEMSDRGVGIIELELARTTDTASEQLADLGSAGRDAARESLYLDFPYLVLYGLFFALACGVVAARASERSQARLARVGRILAVGALGAAACDAAENLALLRAIAEDGAQPWPGLAFGFACAKFALLAAAALYVVVGFVLTVRGGRPAEQTLGPQSGI